MRSAQANQFSHSVPSIRSSAFLLVAIWQTCGAPGVPTFNEMVSSKSDAWGEAAIAQLNGASYEFFAPLLPPPRYVNADFHYYPIVLSAPNAKVKARLISNGSGVNLPGGARSWQDNGTSVTFRVGPDEFIFGSIRERLTDPTLADGYLPIVEVRYLHGSPVQAEGMVSIAQQKRDLQHVPEIYRLEAFASTDPRWAENCMTFVRFSLAQGAKGFISAQVDSAGALKFNDGKLTDDQGRVLVVCDKNWRLERQGLRTSLTASNEVVLAIPTKPFLEKEGSSSVPGGGSILAGSYNQQRQMCAETWQKLLASGMNLETPEPVVNNAWRHLICQNLELVNGDSMRYSAGNQYNAVYEAEGSDAALAFMVWGRPYDMRRLMVPLFEFTRKGLEFHQAGFKIQNICRYFWQTRDAGIFNELKPLWEKEARRLLDNRTGAHGLFPKEQYCGDIHTPVQSINVNTKAWRALRDLGAALAESGEQSDARKYTEAAAEYRKIVLTAIEKSARRETTPPFVPVALYDEEPIHDPICEVRIGSYWNIIIGYTIASGIFPPGSEQENWIPHYLEQHGGLCMGMLRAGGGGEFNFWTGEHRINPLYGTRYALDTQRRDDPERALVCLYGMLAQGFTRNTFVSAEGCSLAPEDAGGRVFYCPPNSAANAHFLSMLRYALVQDWDSDDDGKPDTLRLCFATPKRWLEDGKEIKLERAPTDFGPVSLRLQSRLSQGEVLAEVDLPTRDQPKKTLLRIRVPDGWQVTSAKKDSEELQLEEHATVDLTGLRGRLHLRFAVANR